jgi:hypothetical protein
LFFFILADLTLLLALNEYPLVAQTILKAEAHSLKQHAVQRITPNI